MTTYSRRQFMSVSGSAVLASMISFPMVSCADPKASRQYTLSLRAGAVGIQANMNEVLDLAIKNGFEAISPNENELFKMSKAERASLIEKMKANNITWGAGGVPVDFRKDEAKFRSQLETLPEVASALQESGVTRLGTWIMPRHAELTYLANFKQHATRLKEIAKILGDHNIRFGLEYVGPRTLRNAKYDFVHTMAETKELIAEIGEPNVGFVLDSFHWFCAGDTVEQLQSLSNDDIVACDLNDARSGFSADEQIDGKRELPAATGVIDLKTFMNTLVEIGYDGPVRAEPFNKVLNDMENEAAAKATYDAMKKAFDLVGS